MIYISSKQQKIKHFFFSCIFLVKLLIIHLFNHYCFQSSLLFCVFSKVALLSNSADVPVQMTNEKILTLPLFLPGPRGSPGPPGKTYRS